MFVIESAIIDLKLLCFLLEQCYMYGAYKLVVAVP